jgi:hypothetical protein
MLPVLKQEGEAMRQYILCGSAVIILGLLSSSVAAQKVTRDFDKSQNFSRLKSFVVTPPRESDDPLMDQRITNAIAGVLAARGMTRVVEDGNVVVVPRLTAETRKEVTGYNTGYGPYYSSWPWHWGAGWGYWDGGWGSVYYQVRDVRYDTLIIDVVDGETGALMWRGTGVRRAHSHSNPETVDRELQKIVAKIMSNFPPDDRD